MTADDAPAGLGYGVAARLAALCLTRRGRLPVTHAPSDTVRAGLLVDLALTGRLTSTDHSIEVDPTPTGFAPADRLLTAMTEDPDRPLDHWFDDRRTGLPQVVAALVATGRWRRSRAGLLRRRVYTVTDPADDDWTLHLHDPAGWTAADAAVAALAVTGGLLGPARESGYGLDPPEIPASVRKRTGSARWLCDAAIAHLVWSRRRDRAQARAIGASDSTGPGPG